MRLIVYDKSSAKDQTYDLPSGKYTFDPEKNNLVLAHLPIGLLIERDGSNVVITNQGSTSTILIADVPLDAFQSQVWLPSQELSIDNYILHFENNERQWKFQPLRLNERLIPILSILAVLLLMLVGYDRIYKAIGGIGPKIAAAEEPSPTVTVTITPTVTATSTKTATPTTTPLFTAIPTVITETLTPTPIITVTVIPTTTESLTDTNKLSITMALAVQTPSPSPLRPIKWDPQLDILGVTFEPALVVEGGSYWRLTEARWLDPETSASWHHILVDVVDKNDVRILNPTVNMIMDWGAGKCSSPIRNQEGHVFPGYLYLTWGADCAMGPGGRGYKVYIDGAGLPSDRISNLGMGSITDPQAIVMTSYLLKFQRTTR